MSSRFFAAHSWLFALFISCSAPELGWAHAYPAWQLAPETLAAELKPLSPGTYTVDWQVLSVDTHVTEGRLRFSVSLGGQ